MKYLQYNEKYVENVLKILPYFTFFYFGLSLLLVSIGIFAEEARQEVGTAALLLSIILSVFGIVCGAYLLKRKKWALISLIVIAALQIVSKFSRIVAEGSNNVPALEIIYLVFLIIGLIRITKGKKENI